MKTKLTILLLFLTALCAQAAGPATNVVTLVWNPATNTVPFTYRIYASLDANAPLPWAVLTNVPSTQASVSMVMVKQMQFFYMTSVNATNSAWESDPSNVAQTLWPNQSGGFVLRLGQ